MELLYKASNIEISYDPGTHILHCDWIGAQTEEQIKTSGEHIFRLFREKKCNRILNDNTNTIGPWHHSIDWTVKDWFPRMIRAGLTHFAWVLSNDIFAQLSAKKALPDTTIVRMFNTYAEGMDWLTNKNAA